ncbi:peptide-methionine (S)-S-oxide reductase MsrA [Candidatus Daviesbacteria bacterium]|nr:peptide-methionine (S)-S-oxide reductase MsrA [Candidatus Daviesbacteria bacterium]
MKFATLGGGCFWCTEVIFKRLKGVLSVTAGYAGGEGEDPTYETVSSGNTGFAEAVQIEFEPEIISFKHLLDVFWAMHDPTTLNRQEADAGTQYRSVIFYRDDEQRKTARQSKERMENSGKLRSKIVTEIIPLQKFYTAEKYHQNYYEKNRDLNPYCTLVIDPKIEKLLNIFNKDVKEEFKINLQGSDT